jgi:hypothetical protein
MQRTHPVHFCSIYSVLLAASIFFVGGCDEGSSGGKVHFASETVFDFIPDLDEPQQFIVSPGVTLITVQAWGAAGGDGWNVDGGGSTAGLGGLGGYVEATLLVIPGEKLYVYVGGAGEDATASFGAGGWNGGGDGADSEVGSAGGGGGGASDVRRGGDELGDRILVAGGGGSGSGWCTSGGGNGGHGGGTVGGDGEMCRVSQDLQQQCDVMPDPIIGGELGLRPPFSTDARIVSPSPTTTTTPSCIAENQVGVDNIQLTITNRTKQDFLEVYYVADPQTTITNADGLIDGEEAFRIDNIGSNTPLISESMTPDNIFEANEEWVFILQDYSNTLGVAARKLQSMGLPSGADDRSSGSIIGVVAGNGGTDSAGGWAGGAFGFGGEEVVEEFKNPPFPYSFSASGAGGGGWYGGGTSDGSGGGGGSSYVIPVGSKAITHQQGVQDGNGRIVIQEYYQEYF